MAGENVLAQKVEENYFVGLDLGNRYGKITTCLGTDELIMSYREIPEDQYNDSNTNPNLEYVKYKEVCYIVGETGVLGIDNANKGEASVREISNIFKLVLLGRNMSVRKVKEFNFKIVSGTPYDDYTYYKNDYTELFMSPNGEREEIEMNGEKYSILVEDFDLRKQGVYSVYTLPDRKTESYLIWDWGGGTLDVSWVEFGVRIKGKTFEFSLNEKYEELGGLLRDNKLKIPRPDKHNARFIKTMEKLKEEGTYGGITELLCDDGKRVSLREFVDDFFQKSVDDQINKSLYDLKIEDVELHGVKNVNVGGGAKLLKKELTSTKRLNNTLVAENPEFGNSNAYYLIAKAKKEWK